jgi:predicted HTH domain antitoxin
MTLTLTIPDDLSCDLSAGFHNPCRAALEALAADAYEKDVFSLEQVRRLLDLPSRWEAQALLSKRGVWPGSTAEDFRSDMETLANLRASA